MLLVYLERGTDSLRVASSIVLMPFGECEVRRILLDNVHKMCHIGHMVRISIRELHNKTGKWIRSAARDQKIVVTERGHPIATIGPFSPNEMGTPFSKRREISAFSNLPKVNGDSSHFISDDRNRS